MKKKKKNGPGGLWIPDRIMELRNAGCILWSDAVLLTFIFNYSKMKAGCCTATNKKLATKMRTDIRSVQRQLDKLTLLSLIQRESGHNTERYISLTPKFHNPSFFPRSD